MSKVVCIFAHPDDEAFGPGGTIALLAQTQSVYIICVTNGNAGQNSSEEKRELAEIRREELMRSAEVLGVKQVFFLDYNDGCLCNNIYHEIAEKATHILSSLKPETLLTFEPQGVSGHIDHIAASMITSYLFERLDYVKKIMYYCIDKKYRNLQGKYFIYYPEGYSKSEIDSVVDISTVWEKKVASMLEHKSQKHDAERILEKYRKWGKKEECFLVKEK